MNSEVFALLHHRLEEASLNSQADKNKLRLETHSQLSELSSSLSLRLAREDAELTAGRLRTEQLAQNIDQHSKLLSLSSLKQTTRSAALREELDSRIETIQRDHHLQIEKELALEEQAVQAQAEEAEKKARTQRERAEGSLAALAKKLVALQREFREEAESRKAGTERLRGKFEQELGQVRGVLERERERRVSTERKLLAMMEEVEEKLKEEAEAQSARRAKNNEAMLKLI